MDSVQAFAAKKLDGCAMTSMESLQPASNGVPSVAMLINDRSNGGDGLLARDGVDLEGMKGKTVLLEEFSVSHYLLNRALESVGLKEKDVKIMDFLVMNEDALKANPGFGPCLTDAWFDAMQYFSDEKTRKDAIDIMAKGAGASVEEFEKMLEATDLFTDRKKTADFLEGDKIKATMDKVKKFSFDHDLINNEKFSIGFGKGAKAQLRFDKSCIKI